LGVSIGLRQPWLVFLLAARPLPRRMTGLVSKDKQRELLADKLPDGGNLAVGALFFGQFLSDRPFSIVMALCGIGAWVAVVVEAAILATGREGV
jgi:hypothetical protein